MGSEPGEKSPDGRQLRAVGLKGESGRVWRARCGVDLRTSCFAFCASVLRGARESLKWFSSTEGPTEGQTRGCGFILHFEGMGGGSARSLCVGLTPGLPARVSDSRVDIACMRLAIARCEKDGSGCVDGTLSYDVGVGFSWYGKPGTPIGIGDG